MSGPGVYIFASGKDALYVGKGNNCLSRAVSSQHQRHDVLPESTDVTIIPCPTEDEAKELESRLIALFRPRYNKRRGKFIHLESLSARLRNS